MNDNKGFTRTISTADLTETPRIALEQPTGDVFVEGWDKPEVEVSSSDPDAYFEVEQNGSQITIRNNPGRVKFVDFLEPVQSELRELGVNMEKVASKVERTIERGMRHAGRHGFNVNIDLGNWNWRGGRDYYIKVPHNADLSLRTSSGDLQITGVTGTLLCQTSSGDLKLSNIGGNLLANSASGDITITGLQGKMAVRSASGTIRTRETDLEELNVQTASGDIELDLLKLPKHDVDVRTVSGDLTMYAPYDSRFTVQTRTISGSLSCGFPRDKVSYKAASKRETALDVNGGGLLIQASSVSGDISIRPRKVPTSQSETRQPQYPSETPGAPTTQFGAPNWGFTDASQGDENHGDISQPEGYVSRQQAELDILQKVGSGELSPQEAMQALASLAGES